MNARTNFDLANTPLESGATQIEASAGTGKTFTIAGLVVRLILEKEMRIEQILVSTYTELATAELRDRVRRRIHDAAEVFEEGETEDKFLAAIYRRHKAEAADALRRLNDALRDFDEAPIYTIHGFCQRMLKDRAFESGALFDTELVTDQATVLQEIADDFWRRNAYEAEPILTAITLKHGLSAKSYFDHLQTLVNNPTVRVHSGVETDSTTLARNLVETWSKLKKCWKTEAAKVRAAFLESTDWVKKSHTHGKPDSILAQIEALDRCLSDDDLEDMKCIGLFTSSAVSKAVLKGAAMPDCDLFKLCEDFVKQEPAYVARCQADFFDWARVELKRRKFERNIFSFDDLLLRLAEALNAPGGAELGDEIRGKFKAALIDEFQDTDPVQCAIFQKIYGASDAPVFYIADPKQAIYGFRGADVFTYLKFAAAAKREYTLGENWRSESDLVHAVNAIFEQPKSVFVLDQIRFEPVRASGKADAHQLVVDGVKEPPFKLWLACGAEPITNGHANLMLAAAVAGEISRLLNGDAKIGDAKVQPWDIAVVVASNREARMTQDALSELAIPSVLYSAANVFSSREAAELAQILAAIAEPANERLVRGALVTDTLGVSGEALDALGRQERAWEEKLLHFQKYHDLWSRKGFVVALRFLLQREQVRPRLLRFPDGERRLTNLLQLIELVHRASIEQRLGMAGVLKWIASEMQLSKTSRAEEYEMRLERDEEAVRVITIHKSKGLEYGIVFCPFAWGDAKHGRGEKTFSFHDPDRGDQLTLDVSGASNDREATSLNERLAEKVRLLYVAVTRARNRCYLVWGNFKGGRKSALAHVFSPPEPGSSNAFVALKDREKSLTPEKVREDVDALIGGEKVIEISDVPEAAGEIFTPAKQNAPSLKPRVFEGSIDRSWGISSFTSLLTGVEHDQPDYDAAEPREAVVEPAAGIFAFPRGTKPGTCLHHIFEEMDFGDASKTSDIVRRKLELFGIHGFDEVICETVQKTVAAPLECGVTLAGVPRNACLHELEFHFPIDALTPHRLAQSFKTHASKKIPEAIGRLQFHPANGFMKGFVDLVFERDGKFYIVDWKSNWLGNSPDHYAAPTLAEEMARRFYTVQLHIYTVALHRYLATRIPGYDYDAHFGGAFYIFLRGIDPARPGCGIHSERPSHETIESLGHMFEKGAR